MKVQIKILNKKLEQVPKYATEGSAGLDLRACIDEPIKISPKNVDLIPTGIALYLMHDETAGLILPRSGLGHKKGLVLGNLVGLIDSDYQGEILISAWNRSSKDIRIEPMDRIAQLVIVPIKKVDFVLKEEFEETGRAKKGFGSSGYT
ncbi:MAG: deoxyuridine 5'-triphosphate nucleotidohydrolase [Betaproteobacteria bacterium TMED82]|jgi:dUTP pyrophosphatase|nr:MAG: deoxyuridine 5'-triphosphate nucleotidohydrolase [Betaproteobacteria bacterium TMED82]|tara:strand:- start:2959 stop:3402 length:444 start_codon:yes stop_codon:yes gene_type:complete